MENLTVEARIELLRVLNNYIMVRPNELTNSLYGVAVESAEKIIKSFKI